VEGFGAAVSFEHAKFDLFDGFIGRVASSAGNALAPPANALAFLDGARVDHTVAHVSATGATHSGVVLRCRENTTTGCGVNSLGLIMATG
jgi:hypothetical protein